ncbi:MAG: gliding motility-associated C-terminal domain-containing protein, partial [Mucilaginibacter polytrichastri]|nr:gliding motility-associated C-terminal domain-containing protein [Mucilaginibacter polytrichastri]
MSGFVSVRFRRCYRIFSELILLLFFPAISFGQCPTLDTLNAKITDDQCLTNTGSVTGVTGTGTGLLKYAWYNEYRKLVGQDADLLNVPPGKYTVELRDDNKCSPTTSGPYVVNNAEPFKIDLSATAVKNATCTDTKDGAITGIKVTGATRIEWFSFEQAKVVAVTEDLVNVLAGTYVLNVYSSGDCMRKIGPYTIQGGLSKPVLKSSESVGPTCNAKNGQLIFHYDVTDPALHVRYYLFDKSNQAIKDGLIISNPTTSFNDTIGKLDEGTYRLAIQDDNGCITDYGSYQLSPAKMIIDRSSVQLVSDTCNRGIGRILGTKVIGGTPPRPSTKVQRYKWTDEKNNVISTNPIMADLKAGTYTLTVEDIAGCTAQEVFVLKNEQPAITPPLTHDLFECIPQEIAVGTTAPLAGYRYRLYTEGDLGISMLGENTRGVFLVEPKETTKYYISSLNGSCESEKIPFMVGVAYPGVVIPNGISPNNDGINDTWRFGDPSKFAGVQVTLFNREGKKVYESKSYQVPFDGRY